MVLTMPGSGSPQPGSSACPYTGQGLEPWARGCGETPLCPVSLPAGGRWADCHQHHREPPQQPAWCSTSRGRGAEWAALAGPLHGDRARDVLPYPRYWVVQGLGADSCLCLALTPFPACRPRAHRRCGWCEQWAGCAGQDPSRGIAGAAVHGAHLPWAPCGGHCEAGAGCTAEVSAGPCRPGPPHRTMLAVMGARALLPASAPQENCLGLGLGLGLSLWSGAAGGWDELPRPCPRGTGLGGLSLAVLLRVPWPRLGLVLAAGVLGEQR